MTVIAWDGKTLAADTEAKVNGTLLTVSKIHRTADGRLLGGSGVYEMVRDMYAWLEQPHGVRCKEDRPSISEGDDWAQVIEIIPNMERTAMLVLHEKKSWFDLSQNQHIGLGIGGEMALGAMKAGANAVQAVRIACQYVPGCGLPIEAMDLYPG